MGKEKTFELKCLRLRSVALCLQEPHARSLAAPPSPVPSLAGTRTAHPSDPHHLSWLCLCWGVSIGLFQPNNSTAIICTSMITYIKNLLHWKKQFCFLPLYILQPPMQHLTRDVNDFWKHNTIYHCLSKENYKNANWFHNLHIWFFLKMR